MKKAGIVYEQKFQNRDGLLGTDKPALLDALGLKAEAPQTYTVAGWVYLLKSNGPLWITTDEDPSKEFSIHARILRSIAGDGTPEATFLTFVDPFTGEEETENVKLFTQKFEAVAKADEAKDLRPQVVHY
jgi:hypothetical protein